MGNFGISEVFLWVLLFHQFHCINILQFSVPALHVISYSRSFIHLMSWLGKIVILAHHRCIPILISSGAMRGAHHKLLRWTLSLSELRLRQNDLGNYLSPFLGTGTNLVQAKCVLVLMAVVPGWTDLLIWEWHRRVAVILDLGFTTLLTSQFISVAFCSEREKADKFCSEALISAWGYFTCRKSMTRNPWLYFPSEGSHTQDFYALKNPSTPAGFETSYPPFSILRWAQ